jgi:hypothetical protein
MLKGFLYPFGAQERSLAVLRAYMDESGDKGWKTVFAVGAVIGTDEKWDWLIPEWDKVLKAAHIRYFKSSECGAVDGEFRKYRKDENKPPTQAEKRVAQKVRDQLLDIIIRGKFTGMGVPIDMQAFNRVVDTPEKLDVFGGTPYFHGYYQTMTQVAVLMEKHLPKDYVAFGFDEHEQFGKHLQNVYWCFKERNADIAARITTLAPFDDKLFIPIQAADVIASAVSRFALWKVKKPRPRIPNEWHTLKKKSVMGPVRLCGASCLKTHLRENVPCEKSGS